MNSRKVSAIWQQAAHRVIPPDSGFAIERGLRNSGPASALLHSCADGGQDCYPFPLPWSGPFMAGPFFHTLVGAIARSCVIYVMAAFYWFVFAPLAVESHAITTNNRGRKTSCAKPLSYWLFFQCRLQAVCKTPRRAASQGLRPGPRWPILPTTTRLPARLLAGWRGLQLAASTWACRPVIDLTFSQTAGRPAFGAVCTKQRPSGIIPRLAVFAFLSPLVAPHRSLSHV